MLLHLLYFKVVILHLGFLLLSLFVRPPSRLNTILTTHNIQIPLICLLSFIWQNRLLTIYCRVRTVTT